MQVKDNCAICRIPMTRNPLVKLLPCRHLLHARCAEPLREPTCPICRSEYEEKVEFARTIYKKNSSQDRQRITACANKGDDWVALAQTLGVKYKTAFQWVRSGRDSMLKKGGNKPKVLTDEQIDLLISWVEETCDITIKQLQAKVQAEFNKPISNTTIVNYLEGRVFTMKQVHTEPVSMNSPENKIKRAEYVRSLNNFIRQGKQIVWVDETNFNLFCRRSRGRSKAGCRAVQQLPSARGPNVHVIGAISAAGVVAMERRRGSFTALLANEWIQRLMRTWEELGNRLSDLVIVCDNAPCHSRLEVVINVTEATLLRLGPYSPMLNPIETIWSKLKMGVKTNLRVPEVVAPGIQEQRLQYLEEIIDISKETIMGGDCARAAQHSTTFHAAALALEEMPVGQ